MSSYLTEMQGVELIQDYMKQIAPYRVVRAFIKMKLKPIRTSTVDAMRGCLAVHDYGLSITINLMSKVLGASETSMATRLHNLGDKKCLLLKRTDKRDVLKWTIDPIFLEAYQ